MRTGLEGYWARAAKGQTSSAARQQSTIFIAVGSPLHGAGSFGSLLRIRVDRTREDKPMQTGIRCASLLVALGTLGACGGGGGGGDSGPSVPTSPVAITAANALDIASGVAIDALGTAAAGSFFEIASKTNAPAAPRPTGLTRIMRQVTQLIG